MNGEQEQTPPQRRQPDPRVAWIQKRGASGQLANQIFVELCQKPENMAADPTALVERSFQLAEAFDKKLEDFLDIKNMPKIELATSLPK